MFGSSLEVARPAARKRRVALVLGGSLAIHLLLLGSVLAAQLWQVSAVGEPPVNVTPLVMVTLPPPPPEGDPAAGTHRQPPPVKNEPAKSPQQAQRPQLTQPERPDRRLTPPADPPALTAEDTPPPPCCPQSGPATDDPADTDARGPRGGKKGVPGGDSSSGNDPRPLGPGITPPEIIPSTRVIPRYTEQARRTRVEGIVVLEATINEQGDVTDIRLLRGLPMGLDQEAIEAVRQWKWRPATSGGKPVKVYFTLTVNFTVR